jgi:hypothetical protein
MKYSYTGMTKKNMEISYRVQAVEETFVPGSTQILIDKSESIEPVAIIFCVG